MPRLSERNLYHSAGEQAIWVKRPLDWKRPIGSRKQSSFSLFLLVLRPAELDRNLPQNLGIYNKRDRISSSNASQNRTKCRSHGDKTSLMAFSSKHFHSTCSGKHARSAYSA